MIKLKSNRALVYKPALIFTVSLILITVAFIIDILFIHPVNFADNLIVLIIFLAYISFTLTSYLLAKYYNGKSYIFTKDNIIVYKKGEFVKEIKMSEVVSMNYYPWRYRYLLTIMLGELREGGVDKIHIKDIRGDKHEIGFIIEKDAIKLQEELYSKKLKIMYDKRKNK